MAPYWNESCIYRQFRQPTATPSTSTQKLCLRLTIAPPAEDSGSTMVKHFTTLDPIVPWRSTSQHMQCLFNQVKVRRAGNCLSLAKFLVAGKRQTDKVWRDGK